MGYYDKVQDLSLAQRHGSYLVFRALGGKQNIEQIWPLKGSIKEETIEPPPKEFWEQMKKIHNYVTPGNKN